MTPSRKPDYRIHALDKTTDETHRVGAGWKNPDGSISIVIDRFVVLSGTKNTVITMWENTKP